MSEDDFQRPENIKQKDLVWLLNEDRTPKNPSSSAAKKNGKVTPEQHRNWKVLERGKSEIQDCKSFVKKELDSKLKRSTSFPANSLESENAKNQLALQSLINENEEGQFSPVLYRSKSSLWSVSTESSAIAAHQRCDNRNSEVSCSNSKVNSLPTRTDVVRSLQSPLDAAIDRNSNKELNINEAQHSQRSTPRPMKSQHSVHEMRNAECRTTQPKRTKGLLMSVQEFKSKSDRDPELANDDLKVSLSVFFLITSSFCFVHGYSGLKLRHHATRVTITFCS